jgi:hypothetical protein
MFVVGREEPLRGIHVLQYPCGCCYAGQSFGIYVQRPAPGCRILKSPDANFATKSEKPGNQSRCICPVRAHPCDRNNFPIALFNLGYGYQHPNWNTTIAGTLIRALVVIINRAIVWDTYEFFIFDSHEKNQRENGSIKLLAVKFVSSR